MISRTSRQIDDPTVVTGSNRVEVREAERCRRRSPRTIERRRVQLAPAQWRQCRPRSLRGRGRGGTTGARGLRRAGRPGRTRRYASLPQSPTTFMSSTSAARPSTRRRRGRQQAAAQQGGAGDDGVAEGRGKRTRALGDELDHEEGLPTRPRVEEARSGRGRCPRPALRRRRPKAPVPTIASDERADERNRSCAAADELGSDAPTR